MDQGGARLGSAVLGLQRLEGICISDGVCRIYVGIHISEFVFRNMFSLSRRNIHIHVRTHIHAYIRIYICLSPSLSVYIYIYIYIYIYNTHIHDTSTFLRLQRLASAPGRTRTCVHVGNFMSREFE